MSFTRKGYRDSMKHKIKLTKKHIKSFYKILHELDDVAKAIYDKYPAEEYHEKEIAELLPEFTDLNIDKIEMNILMSKLAHAIHHATERTV